MNINIGGYILVLLPPPWEPKMYTSLNGYSQLISND